MPQLCPQTHQRFCNNSGHAEQVLRQEPVQRTSISAAAYEWLTLSGRSERHGFPNHLANVFPCHQVVGWEMANQMTSPRKLLVSRSRISPSTVPHGPMRTVCLTARLIVTCYDTD